MAKLGPPPPKGESVELLNNYVRELYEHVRALENMRLTGMLPTIPVLIQGKLDVNDEEAVLTIG